MGEDRELYGTVKIELGVYGEDGFPLDGEIYGFEAERSGTGLRFGRGEPVSADVMNVELSEADLYRVWREVARLAIEMIAEHISGATLPDMDFWYLAQAAAEAFSPDVPGGNIPPPWWEPSQN